MSDTFSKNWFDMTRPDLVARLRSLAEDLEVLGSRIVLPFPTDYLDRWALAKRAAPCLVGIPTGHPLESRGIARTQSRWYQLGSRAEPNFRNSKVGGRQ